MGGMLCATFITLLLVPVIYSIFVLDLKLIKWEAAGAPNSEDEQPQANEGNASGATNVSLPVQLGVVSLKK